MVFDVCCTVRYEAAQYSMSVNSYDDAVKFFEKAMETMPYK